MKNYRQVIESIIGKSIDKENINPNLHIEEQLRKVNFRLQEEKDNLMKEVISLRESNSKLNKKLETQLKRRQSIQKESEELKSKLNRTQAIKNSMEQRLYTSNKTLSTKRSMKSERGEQQPSQSIIISNNISSAKSTKETKQTHTATQSVQTQFKPLYDMSIQVDLPDPKAKRQLAESKKKIKELEKTIKLQQKIIEGLEVPSQTHRGNHTERLAGRIVKSSKYLLS